MNRTKNVAGFFIGLLLSVWLPALPALAAQDSTAMWASIQEQTAMVYLRGIEPDQIGECTLGSTLLSPSPAKRISDLDTPIETIVLIDNSKSISETEQALLQEVLTDLIANRMDGEVYTIATVADKLEYLCQDESSFGALKSAVTSIEYHTQETYMIDGIYSELDRLTVLNEGVLCRFIIVTDGADHHTLGYTTDELHQKAATCGYPIYVLGCYGDGQGESGLKELFSLARATSGEAIQLTEDSDSVEIVSSLMDWNNAICMEIALPDSVCDGSEKVLRCSITSGESCSVSITTPVVVIEDEEISSQPEEHETEEPMESVVEQPEESSPLIPGWLPWVLAAVVIVVLGVVLMVVLTKKRNARKEKNETETDKPRHFAQQEPPSHENETVLMSKETDGDSTVMLWDQQGSGILILEDIDQPGRKFDAPLHQGPVTVGRDDGCTISIQWSPMVSRHQCEIIQRGGQVLVRNTSTSNLTKLNEKEVEGEVVMTDGSVLRMGDVSLRVTIL